jgi:hypothetical protein
MGSFFDALRAVPIEVLVNAQPCDDDNAEQAEVRSGMREHLAVASRAAKKAGGVALAGTLLFESTVIRVGFGFIVAYNVAEAVVQYAMASEHQDALVQSGAVVATVDPTPPSQV